MCRTRAIVRRDADIDAARTAFPKLDTALMGDAGVESAGSASRGRRAPRRRSPTTARSSRRRRRRADRWSRRRADFRSWLLAALGVVVVACSPSAAYFMFGSAASSVARSRASTRTRAGQREVAVNAFNKAVRDDPKDPLPHIYLARMAREVGNFTLASQELQLALAG